MKAGFTPVDRSGGSRTEKTGGGKAKARHRRRARSKKERPPRSASPPDASDIIGSPRPKPPPTSERGGDPKAPVPTSEEELAIRQRHNAEIRRILDEQAERVDAKAETLAFHFVRHGRVKRIHLDPKQRERLLRGELVVVGFRRSNYTVPRAAGERIRSLRPEVSVFIVGESDDVDTNDDGYESFEVPDDLIW